MAKELQKYELMMALKPLLPDDVRKAVHKDVVDMVKNAGGEVKDSDVWGKRYLAYDIKGHNEGYYILYQVDINPVELKEMRRVLELKQEVLRYMFVKINHPDELSKSFKKKELEMESTDGDENGTKKESAEEVKADLPEVSAEAGE